jgi:hypothetical protein
MASRSRKAPKSDWIGDFIERFFAMETRLAVSGFHDCSEWWRGEIERFLRSGKRRWVIRAGRRSGKSSTLSRLLVAWGLWGPWSIPRGDVAVVPIVSTDHREANSKLRTIGEILLALNVAYEERADEIVVPSRGVVFRSTTCAIKAAVGFTSIAIFADEMSRWESRDDAANPAREVMSSLRPTMATQPLAFEICSSSPWSLDDFHNELFDDGDTAYQLTSFAATWNANPTITEEQTHGLEPDERVWSREYAAVPGAAISSALDPVDLAGCYGRNFASAGCLGFMAIDASALQGDSFTYTAGRLNREGEFVVLETDGWKGDQMRTLTVADVVTKICARAEEYGVKTVYADNYERGALPELFAQHGITLKVYTWSQGSKHDAMTRLRRLMRERKLSLPDHPALRRQLSNLKQRLMPSGGVKYFLNGQDYASALVTLMHADVDGELVVKPETRQKGFVFSRGEIEDREIGLADPNPRGWHGDSISRRAEREGWISQPVGCW